MLRPFTLIAGKLFPSTRLILQPSNCVVPQTVIFGFRRFFQTVTIDLDDPFIPHQCDLPPSSIQTDGEELLGMFRTMAGIRRMEITADMLFKAGLVRGFCHLYDGQEAVCVGMEAALTPKDSVITAYRDHGPFVARGGTFHEMFAELMGKRSGCAKGKGGSMHMVNRSAGFFGGWGIVGSTAPLGTGLALAHKMTNPGTVAVAIYGDGAANQGQVFEAMNMAALWRLPLIYLVENNHYGMGTSEARASAHTSFYDRVAYMPGLKVNGMDVLAVKAAVKYAKEHALLKGPMTLELDTYRYHGHSMSDPGSTYRQRSEIKAMRQGRDPIERVRRRIIEHGVASEQELKAMEKEVRKEVEEAAQKAREDEEPEGAELWADVYVQQEAKSA